MYMMVKREDTVRIPPDKLGEDLDRVVEELTRESFEGRMGRNHILTLSITEIEKIGEGRIIHGDGGVYQQVRFNALVYKPELQEIVEGTVCEVLNFGAFLRFGPLDGLIHISQIMDDRIDVDLNNNRFIGKESKRDLRVGDKARARIVALSINERSPRESRIGLTMRQIGLGKFEWFEEEKEEKKKKGEKR